MVLFYGWSGACWLSVDVLVLSLQLVFLFLMSSCRCHTAIIYDEVNSDPFNPKKESLLEACLSLLPN